MIIVLCENPAVQKCLQAALSLNAYPAHDASLCTQTPLANLLPFRCLASQTVLAVDSSESCKPEFALGALYVSLEKISAVLFAGGARHLPAGHNAKSTATNTPLVYAASVVRREDGSEPLYADMLQRWYDEEIELRSDCAHACVAAAQRRLSSHCAQAAAFDEAGDETKLFPALRASFELLARMQPHCTGAASAALLRLAGAAGLFSYTREAQLYNALLACERRFGGIPAEVARGVRAMLSSVDSDAARRNPHERGVFFDALMRIILSPENVQDAAAENGAENTIKK